jgi:hypothetical protein
LLLVGLKRKRMPFFRSSAGKHSFARRHSALRRAPSFGTAFAFTLILAVVLALIFALLAWSSNTPQRP